MQSAPLTPERISSATVFISSSVTWQNNFLLPGLTFFWCSFPFGTCYNKNTWVAKQLLLITKVRWDKSHLERLNDLLSRRRQGSAGTWTQPSAFPEPHLLFCIPHHLVYHLKLVLSALNTLWFSSSQQPDQGSLPRLAHTPFIPTSSFLCPTSCDHLSTRARLNNCIST